MDRSIFSYAEDSAGRMVHVDSVPRGLKCGCICPNCKERLQARHGEERAHGFAHCSDNRGANLAICYMVILYKLAEQIVQEEKIIQAPSYYGIFKRTKLKFVEVKVDGQYDRIDKQPDVIAKTEDGKQYLIEFTFAYKVQHKEKIDYKNLNCIEIDLCNQTLESLRSFLLESDEDRKWLNNQEYFDNIESKYANVRREVKVKDYSEECLKCHFINNCYGVKPNTGPKHNPLTIENSGKKYRICKTQLFAEAIKQFEEQLKAEERNRRCEEEYRRQLDKIRAEEERRKRDEEECRRQFEETAKEEIIPIKYVEQSNVLEAFETALVPQTQRTCFMCKNNLDWMCGNGRFAHCGPYGSMGVPWNTPPETAQTCRGFRLKK